MYGRVALLPVTTLRLAGRHLVPLTLWFSVGYLARYVLTWAGVTVGHGDHEGLRRVAATLVFTALVTVTLATVIGMLSVLRRPQDESLTGAICRALFPFVVIYLAWGMYKDDVRAFLRADIERNLYSAAHGSVAGRALFNNLWMALIAVAVAWVLKLLLEPRRERRVVGPVLAYCETAFTLFAVTSVFVLAGKATDWVTTRRIWPASIDLSGPTPDFGLGVVTLPLVWLAMAAVACGVGFEVDDHKAALEGTRLQRVAEKGDRSKVLVAVTADSRERWVPLIQAIRLILRAGAPALGLFCLCYVAVDAAAAYGFRGALHLIGPDHDPAAWRPILVPLEFARELVRTVLHVALLAAAIGLASEVSDETAAPEPDPVPA
ncbi:hypothetical protein [Actinoallomurus soli]|uniref:hypothetical protein n=1 Tax=Actinoallomurus soli TaxID=2952535 RepID=UPI0020923035|nr:hypothetical protein [Actinoallomurus soli]MCO5968995.1 hypothetical protein [Actinoallomurus soli]